jgi:hypothetical protein
MFCRTDVTDLALACVYNCNLINSMDKVERVMELLLRRSVDRERISAVAHVTLVAYSLDGISDGLKRRIHGFWTRKMTNDLHAERQATLNYFVTIDLELPIQGFVKQWMFFPEAVILEKLREFICKFIPPPRLSDIEWIEGAVIESIRAMATGASQLLSLRQLLMCNHEIENGLVAARIAKFLKGDEDPPSARWDEPMHWIWRLRHRGWPMKDWSVDDGNFSFERRRDIPNRNNFLRVDRALFLIN